jgi:flagellar motility protein MotE (MotC chaperone)
MLAFSHLLRRKPKKVQHLEDEDRDFLLFLLSLEEDEFKMMLNSMTDEDAMRVMVMIQQAKDEIFDQWIEENGTPDANDILKRVM